MAAGLKMEILDIVDQKDHVVRKASYRNIYKNLYRHRIVHVLIFDKKGRILLQLRSKNKSFCPLHWSTSVGGHVQSGESYYRAAQRECKEEIGKKLKLKKLFKDIFSHPQYNQGIKKFLTTFKATDEGPFYKGKEEVAKLKFFKLTQVSQMIKKRTKFHPELLFILKKHFKI